MATSRKKPDAVSSPRRPPARTPEGRENQLVDLAVQLAEKQIRDGTASSQIITHYLKLASPREKLERERLERENELLRARVTQIDSGRKQEELYEKAIAAIRSYNGDVGQGRSYDD